MSIRRDDSRRHSSSAGSKPAPLPPAQPAESPHAATLRKVRTLAEAGRVQEAFDLANRGAADPLLKNARGVCLLRMRRPEQAIRVYRELTLSGGGIVVRSDAPLIFKTNYATALLMDGNVGGCREILHEIRGEKHPRISQIEEAIAKFRSALPWFERLMWSLGSPPNRPVELDFVPGDFE